MKPGVIVSISRNQSEAIYSNSGNHDWYREEKWKRISDWIAEIEKETIKGEMDLALVQTRKIQGLLEGIKNKERYREQSMPSYYIAEMENLNKNWNRISSKNSGEKITTLEEENARIRKEIEALDDMRKNIKFR